MTSANALPDHQGSARFATTRWSVVVSAGGGHDSPQVREALGTLCQVYWYPLYAYVRRSGHSADDAQDLVQSFFTQLLEKNRLEVADPQRGKFRSFLLASLKHFLANEWRRAGAQKRGGQPPISLDLASGESRLALEPADELTPEKIYERRWAMTLLEQTLARLREEFAASGKLELFEQVKDYLGGDRGAVPYRQLAAELGMTEGALKVAIHRFRRRWRELMRDQIAHTVTRPEEVNEELRALFNAVAQ
jgi:RNA polymerase sigma-70 factor (ECF subfamily)